MAEVNSSINPENPNAQNSFAVVTGASSGIGYELARVFAENGWDVLINAEDDGIENAARELQALGRGVQAERL